MPWKTIGGKNMDEFHTHYVRGRGGEFERGLGTFAFGRSLESRNLEKEKRSKPEQHDKVIKSKWRRAHGGAEKIAELELKKKKKGDGEGRGTPSFLGCANHCHA